MFNLTLGKTKYNIRVLYKSGNSHTFWSYSFKIHRGEWSWNAVTPANQPLNLGVDEIEAIYQVGYRLSIWAKIPYIGK